MMVAEETKVVARVKSIDPASRRAELEFADGTVRSVPVRQDIDLSRYKVGDNVVIRSTTALTVLAEAFVAHEAHFAVEAIFGFNAWFGFLACAALIAFAKLLGLWLKRPDTYYDEVDRE